MTSDRLIMPSGYWRDIPIPERRKVTICIAAVCELFSQPKIVLCSDWQVNTAFGSAETARKRRPIGKNLVGLFAGEENSIAALYVLFKKHLHPVASLDETNVKPRIEAALDERKRDLTERLVQGRHAISYKDFHEHGKEKLPSNWFSKTTDDIANLKLGAECIIAGFVEYAPMMVVTDQSSNAKIQDYFATVGEGRYLANSAFIS